MIKFLRHLVFDDFLLKLFSFVLALLFWLTVSFAIQEREPVVTSGLSLAPDIRIVFKVPVQSYTAATENRKVRFNPPEVDVLLQGDARLVNDMQTRDVRAFVDLSGADPSRNPTNRVQVSVPPGVTLLRITPATVQAIAQPRT
jgi:YbbR domain-containing protein